MADELAARKIFPRNLTARADTLVRGNPVTTRPDGGVENCYPGLEFDQRNLDKRFFPGLVFEFHAGEGAFVRAVEPELAQLEIELTPDDLTRGVFLWAVFGQQGRPQGDRRDYAVDLFGLDGLSVWRIIHDLEPGPLTVLLGPPRPGGSAPLGTELLAELEALGCEGTSLINRNDDGLLLIAAASGKRARYLDEAGVIDPLAYEPGDLTRSLCAPWQYDFRDCGCFYWASNKPDMVAVAADGPQIFNLQRDPALPQPSHAIRDEVTWTANELNHPQLILGWEALSSVVDVTEMPAYELEDPITLPPDQILPRHEILRRMSYLATVEHGLMVEYLYAYYSLAAPRARPDVDGEEQWRYDASRIILSIAVDEMRHFRWVNEILRELGQPAELARVDMFQDFDRNARALQHQFSLEPLTPERLAWFIEVEKPSRSIDVRPGSTSVDGLYTRMLLSVRQGSDFSADEREKLLHLLKLIIEEGYDHYGRFQRVKALLADLDPSAYLQLPSQPQPLPADHVAKSYEEVADRCYGLVLVTLRYVFETGGSKVGEMLNAARHAMYALDDAARAVTAAGGAPLFNLPVEAEPAAALQPAKALEFRAALAPGAFGDLITPEVERIMAPLDAIGDAGLAGRLRGRYGALAGAMEALV